MTTGIYNTTCQRHPSVETNLRCGRCGDLICPRCMVQSPVGARCPSCASIGRSAMFTTTGVDLGKAIAAAILAGVVTGGLLVGALFVIGLIPFAGIILLIAAQGTAGYLVGEAVRRASRYKISKKLQYVAGFGAFLSYVVSVLILTAIPGFGPGSLTNIIALIGMGISVYVAMNRVRP